MARKYGADSTNAWGFGYDCAIDHPMDTKWAIETDEDRLDPETWKIGSAYYHYNCMPTISGEGNLWIYIGENGNTTQVADEDYWVQIGKSNLTLIRDSTSTGATTSIEYTADAVTKIADGVTKSIALGSNMKVKANVSLGVGNAYLSYVLVPTETEKKYWVTINADAELTLMGAKYPSVFVGAELTDRNTRAVVATVTSAVYEDNKLFFYVDTDLGITSSMSYGLISEIRKKGVMLGNGILDGIMSYSLGHNNFITGNYSSTFGTANNIAGTHNYVLGFKNCICNSKISHSALIGYENELNFDAENYAYAFGYYNKVYWNGMAIGFKNTVNPGSNTGKANGSYTFGHSNTVQNKDTIAVGSYLKTLNHFESAFGLANISRENTDDVDGTLFTVGGGAIDNEGDITTYRNFIEGTHSGKLYIYGIGGYDGTNYGAEGVKDLNSSIVQNIWDAKDSNTTGCVEMGDDTSVVGSYFNSFAGGQGIEVAGSRSLGWCVSFATIKLTGNNTDGYTALYNAFDSRESDIAAVQRNVLATSLIGATIRSFDTSYTALASIVSATYDPVTLTCKIKLSEDLGTVTSANYVLDSSMKTSSFMMGNGNIGNSFEYAIGNHIELAGQYNYALGKWIALNNKNIVAVGESLTSDAESSVLIGNNLLVNNGLSSEYNSVVTGFDSSIFNRYLGTIGDSYSVGSYTTDTFVGNTYHSTLYGSGTVFGQGIKKYFYSGANAVLMGCCPYYRGEEYITVGDVVCPKARIKVVDSQTYTLYEKGSFGTYYVKNPDGNFALVTTLNFDYYKQDGTYKTLPNLTYSALEATTATYSPTVFALGIGANENSRANLFEYRENGKLYIKGIGGFTGANADSADVKDLATVISEGGSSTSYFLKNTTQNSYYCDLSTASGKNSLSLGNGASATQEDSIALGPTSSATGYRSTAVGVGARASAVNAVAIMGEASGANSTAVGFNNTAASAYSLAIGYGCKVTGDGSTYSTAVGYNNAITGTQSYAFGYGNTVAGAAGLVLGTSNTVPVSDCVVLGNNNTVSNNYNKFYMFGHHLQTGANSNADQIIIGRYNDYSNDNALNPVLKVGVGTSDERLNAMTILQGGKVYIKGLGSYAGTELTSSMKDIATVIGDLDTLTTTSKDSIVGSINSLASSIKGTVVAIDDYLVSGTAFKYDVNNVYTYQCTPVQIVFDADTGEGNYIILGAVGVLMVSFAYNESTQMITPDISTIASLGTLHLLRLGYVSPITYHYEEEVGTVGSFEEGPGYWSASDTYEQNLATAWSSYAGGAGSKASAEGAFARGYKCTAGGLASNALGYQCLTTNEGEFACGKFNASTSNTTRFSVGCGSSTSSKSNGMEVTADGKVFVKNVGSYDGTNPSSATDLATAINSAGGETWVNHTDATLSITITASTNATYYECSTALTSLTIDHTEACPKEITIHFTAGTGFAKSFTPNQFKVLGLASAFEIVEGKEYELSIKNNIFALSNIETAS